MVEVEGKELFKLLTIRSGNKFYQILFEERLEGLGGLLDAVIAEGMGEFVFLLPEVVIELLVLRSVLFQFQIKQVTKTVLHISHEDICSIVLVT